MSETITGANSVVTITVPGLYPTPVQLHGYSAEKAWNTDQQQLAETLMGVDGHLSGGWTPTPVKQTFSLQADSPSKSIFNTIKTATRAQKEIYYISATITLPATGQTFICVKGVLTEVKSMPDFGKVLQPMDFTIVWESVTPSVS